MRSQDVDVAVVGAGAAGIAAARRLRARGIGACILEAADRTGGRAFTSAASLGVAVDRGCAWLHSAERNPLRTLADRAGIEYGGNATSFYHVNGSFLGAAEAERLQGWLARSNQLLVETGRGGRDVAAAELLDAGEPHAPIRDYLITAINGVAPEAYATAEAAADHASEEDYAVWDGLGRLIAGLSAGLDVRLDARVEGIEQMPQGVRLVSTRGTLRARAAIVTVSTGVLRADAIRFSPGLPDWKQAALDAIPMGCAEKVVLRFARDVTGLPANSYLTVQSGEGVAGFHFYPGTETLAVSYAGGDAAAAIARGTPGDAAERRLCDLEQVFGTEIRRHLLAAARTAWLEDARILGGYSAARPGGGHRRRRDLAAPIGGALYFAGEATDMRDFATVNGAWQSGRRAADEIVEWLGSAVR